MRYNVVVKKESMELEHTIIKRYKEGQRKVCFTAFVSANLLDIILLSYYHYSSKDYKVLIMSNWNCKGDYDRIKEIMYDAFDEVILINDQGRKLGEQRFINIRKQFRQIDFKSFDIVHLSAFNQNSFLCELVHHLSPHTLLIQNQFTGTSYYVKEYYGQLANIYVKHKESIKKLVKRIDELWVHDKDLIIGDTEGIVVRNMGFEELYKDKVKLKELCKKLNRFYDYKHEKINNKVVFLEQPLYKYFKNSHELELGAFDEMLKVLKDYDVMVKIHPRSDIDKYKDYSILVYNGARVPWELVLLNELAEGNPSDKIYITYFSDSLNNGHMILSNLGIKHYCIRTIAILQEMTSLRIGTELLDKFHDKFFSKYNSNIYNVKDLKEFRNVMDGIINETI